MKADAAIASLGPTTQRAATQASHPLAQLSNILRGTGIQAQTTATQHEAAAARTASAWGRAAAAVKASGAAIISGMRDVPKTLLGTDRDLKSVGRSITSTGRNIRNVGRGLTRSITLPLALVGGAAVKMSLDFDESMTQIRALVGASAEQITRYKEEVLSLAKEGPVGPRALADALYFVTSSGFAGEAALRVLRASSQAAAAGLGEVKLVADAVTSAVTAYGESNLSASRAVDIMVGAVRLGKGEAQDLAQTVGKVIAPAESLGVEFEEVAASLSSLSLVGIDFFEGATAVRGIMMALIKPTKETREFLDGVGESVKDLRAEIAERGLITTLQRLRDRFGDNKDALGILFPNVRALNGFLALTGKAAQKTADIQAELSGNIGETARAAAAAAEDPLNKLRKAWSRISVDLIKVGEVIVPVVVMIADAVADLADQFDKLSPHTKQAVLVAAALLAVLGPLVSMIGLAVIGIGGMTIAMGALSAVSLPVLAVVAAVVLLGGVLAAAVFAPEQLAAGLEKLGLSAGMAEKVVKALQVTAIAVFETVKFIVMQFVNSTKMSMEILGGAIDVVVGILTLDFARAWRGLKNIATAPLKLIVDGFKNFGKAIKSIFSELWTNVKERTLEAILFILEKLDFKILGKRIIPGVHSLVKGIEAELDKIQAKRAGERAAELYKAGLAPGFRQAGRSARMAAQREIEAIDTRQVATKVSAGLTPGFFKAGTDAGNAWGSSFVAAMDPWFLIAAKNADTALDMIATSVTDTLNNLGSSLDLATAGAFGVQAAEAYWDGKRWRNAQGKVLKDQAKAWDAFNAKMKNSIVVREVPEVGTRINLNTKFKTDQNQLGGAGGDDRVDKSQFSLPFRFQERELKAQRTKQTADDMAVLKDEEAFLRGLLERRNLSQKKRLAVESELTRVITAMQSINDQIASDLASGNIDLPNWLVFRKAAAEATSKNLKDDLAVMRAEERFYKKLISNRKTTLAQRRTAKLELVRVQGEIRDLERQIAEAAFKEPVLLTPELRIRLTKAERTEGLKDDIAANQAYLKRVQKMLADLPKTKKFLEKRAELEEEKTRVLQRIRELKEEQSEEQEKINAESKRFMRLYLSEQANFFSSFGPTVFTQSAGAGGQTVRTPGTTQGTPPATLASGGFVKPRYLAVGGSAIGDGGMLPRGTDTVPAMLTPGELVLNQRQQETLSGTLGVSKSGLFERAKGGSREASIKTPLVKIMAQRVELSSERRLKPDGVVRSAGERPALAATRGGFDETTSRAQRPVEVHFHDVPQTANRKREAMYAETAFKHAFD